MKTISHLINGEQVSNDRQGDVYNPAIGKVQAKICLADKEQVDMAAKSGHEAFLSWQEVTPINRARIMCRFKTAIEEKKNDLAALITQEHGKTLADAQGSVMRGLEVVEFACGIPHLLKGEYSANVGRGVDAYSLRQPLGVCVGITPFNFPAMVPLWMFPLALACGNSFILKISEKVPSSANFLGELALEAGFPLGVLNVLHGDRETVSHLLHHPLVKAVSFVGSTQIAQSIYETSAKNGKRVQALGGAKNHLVVMPDADINQAVSHISSAAYGSAGERCMAVSVVMCIGDDVADAVSAGLQNKINELSIGAGDQENVDMGPLITAEHLAKVKEYVEIGVKEGAELIVDGRDFKKTLSLSGFFLGPCLFDRVLPEMRIYQEEIFGPVLGIVRLPELNRAIELINAHPFGNGVSIFTNHGAIARKFVDKIQVGMVGVNVPIPVPVAYYSFGGWKQSLFGDTHMHGMEGIRFYTKGKVVTQRWQELPDEKVLYRMPTLS